MATKHYKEQLSAFVDQELSKEDRQKVAEHLISCELCRREHDRIKLGAGLAATLNGADAPKRIWNNIRAELDDRSTPRLEAFSKPSVFDLRHAASFAVALIVVGLVSFFVYRGLFAEGTVNVTSVQNTEAVSDSKPANSSVPVKLPPSEANTANTYEQATSQEYASAVPANGGSWAVEVISGSPKVGDAASPTKIAVGEYLVTDANSRARIEVADIGKVDIQPNSRVKLVGTNDKQHRLALDRGSLHAKISAPPRLFIVDTPSGQAVDLGCEYTLDVDNSGNTKLNVLSGFVALELGGRESIVPAGASCLTVKGKGIGTPFSSVASEEFEQALYRFDFTGGGSRAVRQMVDNAEPNDIVTLWHLLSRVPPKDRATIFESLAKFVPPPDDVSRDGILSLNNPMLESWRLAVENAWFKL